MRVSKWGNSLAVRLPAPVVEALGLKDGDEVRVHVVGARDFEIERDPAREEALARLRAVRWKLPAGFRFDRWQANAR